MKVQAMFYERIKDKVHCFLCPHNCVIENGHFGRCNVRKHEDGKLFTINYGQITSAALDPIEKKPLSYFKPSTYILSVGTFGCNFKCGFCQNHSISQFVSEKGIEGDFITKEELVETALSIKNNIGIAFTYNEPSIWYEYVYDCAKLLKEREPNASIVLVTNGYINEEPLKQLLPYTDAMNIDLKSFKNEYYKNICGGSLKPVLKTIETAAKHCHVEITTLLVTGENDNLDEVEQIAAYLGSIRKDIPLHLTRYFPRYKYKNPPTDISFMKKAEEVAKKHLSRVVLGNV
ncbi:MAG: AmmeMemoRadiSam system radical SAM enzyme [Clostridiaceae bacterium]|nr:AmmeMemoRadiSam system radical SAM enzyme [Clostridiaceae bacterium]